MLKRRFTPLLIMLLCLSMLNIPLGSAAGNKNENESFGKHWAVDALEKWNDQGILRVGLDATINPDKEMTRGEFIALINFVFNYIAVDYTRFTDVPSSAWYREDVAKAAAAGYMKGVWNKQGQLEARAEQKVSRQEAAAIIYRAFGFDADLDDAPSTTTLNQFIDSQEIAHYAKPAMALLVNEGYLSGYQDGQIKPKRLITLAEAITILDRVSGYILNEQGIFTGIFTGNLVVNRMGISLKNATILGDLYLGEGIEAGGVTLSNIVVKGNVYVRGGGENSILIDSATISGKVIDVVGDGRVRVVIRDSLTPDIPEVLPAPPPSSGGNSGDGDTGGSTGGNNSGGNGGDSGNAGGDNQGEIQDQLDRTDVANAKEALTLEGLAQVVSNLSLPANGANGTTIVWSSDKPNMISSSGIINRPAFDQANGVVTLTAVITKGIAAATKIFTATVLAKEEMKLNGLTIGGYAAKIDAPSRNITLLVPNSTNLNTVQMDYTISGEKLMLGSSSLTSGQAVRLEETQQLTVIGEASETVIYTLTIRKVDKLINTGLPTIVIETAAPVVDKENKINGTMLIQDGSSDPYGTGLFIGDITMKGRGNFTWGQPKKPYAIELLKDAQLLDLPKDDEWVLLANYADKSLMRNFIAFEFARLLGMDYSPRARFVDVYINGIYQGNYNLTEKIKISNDRVAINKIEETDVSGDALTGGYLIEKDYRDRLDADDVFFETTLVNGGNVFAIKGPKKKKFNLSKLPIFSNIFKRRRMLCTELALLTRWKATPNISMWIRLSTGISLTSCTRI